MNSKDKYLIIAIDTNAIKVTNRDVATINGI